LRLARFFGTSAEFGIALRSADGRKAWRWFQWLKSHPALFEKWPDLIDIDAGHIATGAASIEEVGGEIFRFILEVASGRKQPWAEHWGLANALSPFNPGPVT